MSRALFGVETRGGPRGGLGRPAGLPAAIHLPAMVFLASLIAGTLTRLSLVLLGRDGLDLGGPVLLAAFGRGALADLGMALAGAGAAFVVSGLTHGARPTQGWRVGKRVLGHVLLWGYCGFIAVAEWLFWEEFSTRFNFIAVDYLIYTTEVVGNIHESYPLPAILGSLAAFAVAASVLALRVLPVRAADPWPFLGRCAAVAAGIAMATGGLRLSALVNDGNTIAVSLGGNVQNRELARNGPASFLGALRDNSLSYERFYATVDAARADALAGAWPRDRGPALLPAAQPRRPRHVVLVTIESLSGEYVGALGSTHGLTPNLDAIHRESVSFTQMYAIGTRTVRGLEALSIALPPLPGQSIVRRPEGAGVLTLGSLLREHGFETTFLYGGYGYFDNMNDFFASNGYRVRDRRDFAPDPQRFENVWGVADEYLFGEALAEMDRAERSGRRALLHVMTTSNHRPYTYPEGRVALASGSGRSGAVQYTDWAIGDFLRRARTRPWFEDTLFVFVADHCASSTGRTSLPPDRYRIPAMLYAPKYLQAREIDALSSQIDLVPTLVGWLGFDDGGRFFGANLLAGERPERAFLGTFQEIGVLTPRADGARDLVVLAPRRRVSQYIAFADEDVEPFAVDPALAEHAIARFSQASRVFDSGAYRSTPVTPTAPRSPGS